MATSPRARSAVVEQAPETVCAEGLAPARALSPPRIVAPQPASIARIAQAIATREAVAGLLTRGTIGADPKRLLTAS
jgi:hypothetical protein